MRRLLWAADTAGLNGYQDPNSGQELNSDSITSVQEPDGTYRLITPQEYERLSDEDKATADTQLESLAKSADGMGTAGANVKTHFDQQFQERYS
ncbi:hypothetical protein [Actinomyces ruminis]|uniref:Uncharacterized protein n=1 Tax=Actinomyces ruminis TaxID=1937003 RepID=A0ABX4M984_9ACTO|nr:hypothetical protein [Actinomyces ruminis]PHP51931.1 hypothetical protein BW737_013315 [Actinomyces ruminis]